MPYIFIIYFYVFLVSRHREGSKEPATRHDEKSIKASTGAMNCRQNCSRVVIGEQVQLYE